MYSKLLSHLKAFNFLGKGAFTRMSKERALTRPESISISSYANEPYQTPLTQTYVVTR
jgi:hypothetical protein